MNKRRSIVVLLVAGLAMAGCGTKQALPAPAPDFTTTTSTAPPTTAKATTTTAPTTTAPTGAASPQQLIPEFVSAYGTEPEPMTNAQIAAKLTGLGLVTQNFVNTLSQESDSSLAGISSTATAGTYVQIDGTRWNVAVGLTTDVPGITTTTTTVTWDLTIVPTPTGYEVDQLVVAPNQANTN